MAVAIKPPSYVLIFYFVFYYVVLCMAAGRSFVFLGAMDPGGVVNFAFFLSFIPNCAGGRRGLHFLHILPPFPIFCFCSPTPSSREKEQ